MSFLGQDWGLANLKGKAQGLLADPNAQMENPWFRMGMGLLSENQKPYGGDPFGAAISAMKGAKETEQQRKDRERVEQLRKQLAELIQQRQMQMGGGVQDPRSGGWMTPVPPAQQPPRSIMDLYRASGQ